MPTAGNPGSGREGSSFPNLAARVAVKAARSLGYSHAVAETRAGSAASSPQDPSVPAPGPRRPRTSLFVVLALLAVAGVNAAGLKGIAVARRGAAEEAARLFQSATEARARSLESRLSAT